MKDEWIHAEEHVETGLTNLEMACIPAGAWSIVLNARPFGSRSCKITQNVTYLLSQSMSYASTKHLSVKRDSLMTDRTTR
jgi:hypothetical protein